MTRAAVLRAADGEEIEIPEGEGPLVRDRAEHVAGSGVPSCCAWRWRRWRMSRCGCWRRPTGTGPRSRSRCRRTRCWCRGCAYSQAMPAADAGDLPRGSRDGCAGAGGGGAGAGLSGGRGHGENGARVAWSGAGLSLPRRLVSPRGVRLAVRRLLGDESYRARGRGARGAGRGTTTVQRHAAELVEEAARERDEPALAGSSVIRHRGSGGGTRTHNLSVNSRALYH